MLSEIKKLVPRAMREPVGRAFREARDQYWRARFGRHASLVPPRDLMHDGPQSYQDFKRNGDEFLRHYIESADCNPTNTCSTLARVLAAKLCRWLITSASAAVTTGSSW